MSKPRIDLLLRLFKTCSQKNHRDYSQTFHVADDLKIIYSDGFFILVVDTFHNFLAGTHNIAGGMSKLKYPNYHSVLPTIKTHEASFLAERILELGAIIKPSSVKKPVSINRYGQINNYIDTKYNCNLSHAVIAASLECETCRESEDGAFIFKNDSVLLLSSGIRVK
jgi:hypothetical protein